MTTYNITLHLKSGNRLFLQNMSLGFYSDIRDWLSEKETVRTFDGLFVLPYSGNKYRKPTTYYFPPAKTFVEYFEINQVDS